MFLKASIFMAAVFLVPVIIGAVVATGVAGVTGAGRAWAVLLSVVIVIAVVGILVWALTRSFRPVRDLVQAAGALADGDYTARVEASGAGGIRPVVTSFNSMAEQLEMAGEQRRRLLADVGHELRTPLTVLRGEIEAMVDGVHPLEAQSLEPLLDDVSVMERLLEDLRTLSDAEAGTLQLHREPTDLGALLSDVAAAYTREAATAGVEIEVEVSSGLEEMLVDPIRLREVATNLVVNAIRAMPGGGSLFLRAHSSPHGAVLQFEDTGVGIEPTELEQVFERFHKGHESGGSGLGLTISRDLVEAHGGSLALESVPNRGTKVVVTLPPE